MTNPDSNLERPDSTGAQHPPAPPTEASLPMDPQQPAQTHEPEQQLSQLSFQPLLSLVTDSTTRATHHPRVHYIFSDDDPDILTDALAQYGHHSQAQQGPSPSGSGCNPNTKPLPQVSSSSAHSIERAIVLDLVPKALSGDDSVTAAATGYEVAWASSLSADWAVISAKLTPMADESNPNPGTSTTESDSGAQQLMLRIEGVGVEAGIPSTSSLAAGHGTRTIKSSAAATSGVAAGRKPSLEERDLRMSRSGSGQGKQGSSPGADQGKEDYGAIVDEFEKRMCVLRKVVDAGLERQRRGREDPGVVAGANAGAGAAEERGEVPPIGTHSHDWGAVALEQGQEASHTQPGAEAGSRRASTDSGNGGGGGE